MLLGPRSPSAARPPSWQARACRQRAGGASGCAWCRPRRGRGDPGSRRRLRFWTVGVVAEERPCGRTGGGGDWGAECTEAGGGDVWTQHAAPHLFPRAAARVCGGRVCVASLRRSWVFSRWFSFVGFFRLAGLARYLRHRYLHGGGGASLDGPGENRWEVGGGRRYQNRYQKKPGEVGRK